MEEDSISIPTIEHQPNKPKTAIKTIVTAVIALLALAILFEPTIRISRLKRELYATSDASRVADIAKDILKLNTRKGDAALTRYAEQNALAAFASTHRIFLVHDDSSGATHVAYYVANGKYKGSISLGTPAIIMSGVHLLKENDDGADFVLRAKDGVSYHRLCFNFEEGDFIGTTHYDVSANELSEWKQLSNWPDAWK